MPAPTKGPMKRSQASPNFEVIEGEERLKCGFQSARSDYSCAVYPACQRLSVCQARSKPQLIPLDRGLLHQAIGASRLRNHFVIRLIKPSPWFSGAEIPLANLYWEAFPVQVTSPRQLSSRNTFCILQRWPNHVPYT